jgi:uncharacterized protein (DUF302 family)
MKSLNVLATIALLALPALAMSSPYAVYESESDFDTVLDAAKNAIAERGLYINNVMHLGEMLERTGKDLGIGGPIYRRAESIEFCSATLSRKMTEENPNRLVNCPFILSIYTLPGQEGKTYIVHRNIPTEETANSAAMREVAEMLKGVAEGAASW